VYKRIFAIFSVSTFLLIACSLTSSLPTEDGQDGESLEDRISGTSSANQTATAEIEKAIQDALDLTASAATDTPAFTDTPVPPTDTPEPTETPTPSPSPTIDYPNYSYVTSSGDCKNETGRIEIRNNTGEPAELWLTLDDSSRTCSYYVFSHGAPGFFWIEPGRYNITVSYCGHTESFTNPLNSGWYFALKATYCN
jgi:hypothetical protein